MPAHVIYARKSTESEDRQVLSIDSQVQELKTLASGRGIPVAEVLTESKSAKAPGRPVFGTLMRRVHRGEIRSVLCWKMDRLARNHLDTGTILQALADGELHEVVTSDRTYTRDGNDRFMGNFELGMATKFIDDLRANVRRGNRAKFQQGWINHNPPLGYLLDPKTKTIVKDPDRFDLVRRMWELVLSGTTRPSEVLQIANKTWGLRTRRFKRIGGKSLCRSTIFEMLGNPFYMGVIRLRSTGETFVGAHPPMVSREEFDRVQEILGRHGRARPQRHAFAFTGLITCGHCGGRVTAEEHVKKSGKRYVYYHCSRTKAGVTCREPAITARDLEEQLAGRLKFLTIPERIHRWLVDRVGKDFEREKGRREVVRETIEKALAGVTRELDNLVSLRLRDLLSDEEFVKRKREIEERKTSLAAKLRGRERSGDEVKALTIKTFDLARCVVEKLRSGTRVQKRMILEAVGLNYVLKGRKFTFSLKTPFKMIAEAGACSNWWACADDVRTWIQDTTEYFALPDLDAASCDITVPQHRATSKTA